MKYVKLLCLIVVAGVALSPAANAAEHTSQSLAQIKQQLDQKQAVLVDVRERKEWEASHIDGAIFLPLSIIRDGLTSDELKPLPKDKVLYVHCVVGQRALLAANALERYGFKVRPMKPGHKEMMSAGFPEAK
ncbi:MAG: rhodanese-like domain-containing protein [Planctomycetaceae bacterium]